MYRRARALRRAARGARSASETLTAERIFINVGGRAAVPAMPGLDERPVPRQQLDDGRRLPAAAPDRRRRQLHRPRVRADVPPLRQRGDGHRDGAAADPARGRGRVRDRSPRSSPARASTLRLERDVHRVRAARRRRRRAGRLRRRRARRSSARTCCSPSGGARTPTTSASSAAGVAVDARGYIVVDDELRTSVPGIWALGDCNGRGAFTHTSYNDFEIVAANLLDGDARAASATASRPTRSTSIRRSAAPA